MVGGIDGSGPGMSSGLFSQDAANLEMAEAEALTEDTSFVSGLDDGTESSWRDESVSSSKGSGDYWSDRQESEEDATYYDDVAAGTDLGNAGVANESGSSSEADPKGEPEFNDAQVPGDNSESDSGEAGSSDGAASGGGPGGGLTEDYFTTDDGDDASGVEVSGNAANDIPVPATVETQEVQGAPIEADAPSGATADPSPVTVSDVPSTPVEATTNTPDGQSAGPASADAASRADPQIDQVPGPATAETPIVPTDPQKVDLPPGAAADPPPPTVADATATPIETTDAPDGQPAGAASVDAASTEGPQIDQVPGPTTEVTPIVPTDPQQGEVTSGAVVVPAPATVSDVPSTPVEATTDTPDGQSAGPATVEAEPTTDPQIDQVPAPAAAETPVVPTDPQLGDAPSGITADPSPATVSDAPSTPVEATTDAPDGQPGGPVTVDAASTAGPQIEPVPASATAETQVAPAEPPQIDATPGTVVDPPQTQTSAENPAPPNSELDAGGALALDDESESEGSRTSSPGGGLTEDYFTLDDEGDIGSETATNGLVTNQPPALNLADDQMFIADTKAADDKEASDKLIQDQNITNGSVDWSTASREATDPIDQGSRSAPSGFDDITKFNEFGDDIRSQLEHAGYPNTEAVLHGSAVTGKSFSDGKPFDVGRTSDFDVALANPDLLARAQENGIELRSNGTRSGPLHDNELEKLGLTDVRESISGKYGRPVNFMLYDSTETALSRQGTPGRIIADGLK